MSALDSLYWDSYAQDHSKHYNEEMAKFIRDLAVSLRVQSVLELGCSAGNDLKLFAQEFDVRGIDSSRIAIEQARKNLPKFRFEVGQVDTIPFEDNSIDLIFTRNLFNHVEPVKIDEMFRVSKKYIFNIELFSENEQKISDNPTTYGRNMKQYWMDYKIKLISNVDMHEEIDPKKSRFTLLRKI